MRASGGLWGLGWRRGLYISGVSEAPLTKLRDGRRKDPCAISGRDKNFQPPLWSLPEVNWRACETGYSFTSSAEVKNSLNCNCTPLCTFVAKSLIKRRDTSLFTFTKARILLRINESKSDYLISCLLQLCHSFRASHWRRSTIDFRSRFATPMIHSK